MMIQRICVMILIIFFSNKIFSNETKPKQILVTIDKSGSMTNTLTKDTMGSINKTVQNLLIGREPKSELNFITYNKSELKLFLKRTRFDTITFYHYGTKIDKCITSKFDIKYINKHATKCLPNVENNFISFFNENLTIMYLPELEVLKQFDYFRDNFWIDISDKRPDDSKNIPNTILENWDKLHKDINNGNVILRVVFPNGIYLTVSKLIFTQTERFQIKTDEETNTVFLFKENITSNMTQLRSKPFQFNKMFIENKVDIKDINLQWLNKKGEVLKLNEKYIDEKEIELEGKFKPSTINYLVPYGIIKIKYMIDGKTYESIIPNVSILIKSPPFKYNIYLYIISIICFFLILIFWIYKKIKNSKQEQAEFISLKISAPNEGILVPKFYEIQVGEKIVFDAETKSNLKGNYLYDIRMKDQYIQLKSIQKKQVEFFHQSEPSKNKLLELPCEIELRNKFGKIVKLKIES